MMSFTSLILQFLVLHVQVICKPGTVKTNTKFEAEVYILTKEEGGRHTAFFSNYRPQFYLRTADVTGKVELPEHIKMVMPGDNLTAQFELIIPCPLEHGKLPSPKFAKYMCTHLRRVYFLVVYHH